MKKNTYQNNFHLINDNTIVAPPPICLNNSADFSSSGQKELEKKQQTWAVFYAYGYAPVRIVHAKFARNRMGVFLLPEIFEVE